MIGSSLLRAGRALMWLHEQEVIRLHKGLAVFRSAMTIRLGSMADALRLAMDYFRLPKKDFL